MQGTKSVAVLDGIREKKDLTPELTTALEAALTEFAGVFQSEKVTD